MQFHECVACLPQAGGWDGPVNRGVNEGQAFHRRLHGAHSHRDLFGAPQLWGHCGGGVNQVCWAHGGHCPAGETAPRQRRPRWASVRQGRGTWPLGAGGAGGSPGEGWGESRPGGPEWAAALLPLLSPYQGLGSGLGGLRACLCASHSRVCPRFGEEACGNSGLLAKVAAGQAASLLTPPGPCYSGWGGLGMEQLGGRGRAGEDGALGRRVLNRPLTLMGPPPEPSRPCSSPQAPNSHSAALRVEARPLSPMTMPLPSPPPQHLTLPLFLGPGPEGLGGWTEAGCLPQPLPSRVPSWHRGEASKMEGTPS